MPSPAPDPLPAQDTVPEPPRRVQILLVEDDPDFVLVLRHLLDRTALEYAVVMAYTIAEIGSRPLPVRPQVALVDQNLPDGQAADAITRIEATWPGLPVVVLTAHADRQQAVALMKRGAYDYLQKDELDAGRVQVALEHALERSRLATDLAAAQARLRDWAIRDELTGLYNRRHARTRLDQELARATRHRHPLTVLMADLDHFKTLNDTFGHRMGDEALRVVAQVLQAECRAGDLVTRYGGEEFLVLLPDTPGDGGEQTAERIRQALAQAQVRCDGERARMTVSIGVASLEDVSQATSEVLIQAADRALYAAKRAGRDRVHRAGRSTGPLGAVAQGSEVRQRIMDGLVTLMRTANPALEVQSQRAVARAEALANAHDLPVHTVEALLTACRLLPLRALTGGHTDALEAALAATGVLAQEGRLIGQASQAGPESPAAVQILALVGAALPYPDASEAVEALRQPAGCAYDAAMVDALAALEGPE